MILKSFYYLKFLPTLGIFIDNQIMKATLIFVILQFIVGLGLAIGGIFLFAEYDKSSLNDSILLGFIIVFLCILSGVGLAGYFHLRAKHATNRFGTAMLLSFAGLFAFLVLYFFIEPFLPSQLGILSLFVPLTGAVFGFNLIATKADAKQKQLRQ